MTEEISGLSPLAQTFQPGLYKHFKGGTYEALYIARHSEDPWKEFVVYKSLATESMWIRLLEMFFEIIERDDYKGPRFMKL